MLVADATRVHTGSWQRATCTQTAISHEHQPFPPVQAPQLGRGSPAGNICLTDEAVLCVPAFVALSREPRSTHGNMCPGLSVSLRFRGLATWAQALSSRPTCLCARLCSCTRHPHPRLSAALMTLAQRKVMTNARYQRTRPMTNGRAPEQPHYAVITEDGWPSAPPPLPSAPVTGAHQAPPSGEGATPPAQPPIMVGQAKMPRPGAWSPSSRLQRRNKAVSSAGAGGALGVPLARGEDTQLCTHMACTRASRLCPCTVHLQLLSRHNPHLTGSQTPCMGIHLPPDLGTHPPAEIQAHRAMLTPTPAICARACRNHLCRGTCMLPTCLHMHG